MTIMSFRGEEAAYLMPALREVEVKRMRGKNELILNKATMIEAVQEWLDKRWSEPQPVVQSVAAGGRDGHGGSADFVITLEGTDKPLGEPETLA